LGSRVRFRRYRTRKYTLHTVTDLRAEDNYTLWVRFDDGLEGHVYLGELVATTPYGVLSDAEMFCRVAIDPVSNTVTWGGGLDIDPEVLYRDLASKATAALH
jgi:hypothetical protein